MRHLRWLVCAAAILAARGESPVAFDRRSVPADGVAPGSNTRSILAWSAGPIAGLDATWDFHHGLWAGGLPVPGSAAAEAIGSTQIRSPDPAVPPDSRPALLAALDRFERGNGDNAGPFSERQLTLLSADLRNQAPTWVAERGPAEAARRRLAVATYVLGVLGNVEDSFLWQDTQAAATLLEWACALLREAPPVPVELGWHAAGLSLLERAAPPDLILRHLAHAEARFPGQGRWALLRAAVEEQRTWAASAGGDALVVTPKLHASVAARYQEATTHESVREEAEVRWGFFELAQGLTDAALTHFDRAGTPADQIVRYWLLLFKGRALEQVNRVDDAVAAFRLAMGVAPFAQSAALALAGALVSHHRPAEAAEIVSRSLSVADRGLDPWVYYATPDGRFWPGIMADLMRTIGQ
jgi:tetratricopeptide (TPR) repeat protein